jgi:hypothetical protein
MDTRRRIELEQQLTRALVERADSEAHLAAAQEQLSLLSANHVEMDGRGRMTLRIHRRGSGAGPATAADHATQLLPGDVLDVRIERTATTAALP